MNNFFIYSTYFRLSSPILFGVLVYLLILLTNNNVAQVSESFLNEELYLCIGIAFLIQEICRIGLWCFDKARSLDSFLIRLTLLSFLTIVVSLVVVNIILGMYYRLIIGFSPAMSELWIFNLTYVVVVLIYFTLYFSHYFLSKSIDTELEMEQVLRDEFEEDYLRYTKGINARLLFDSLEAVIANMRHDRIEADQILEYLANIYRYQLSKRNAEVINLKEEVRIAEILVGLYNSLPYRNISLKINELEDCRIIPGSLISVLEKLIRTSIAGDKRSLEVSIEEEDCAVILKYIPQEKITTPLNLSDFEDLKKSYAVLSSSEFSIVNNGKERLIQFPKLVWTATS